MKVDIWAAQQGLIVFFEALIRFAAIEADSMDMRVSIKQGDEVVALFIFYVRVKAAFSLADSNGIPQGNMVAEEYGQAFLIVSRWRCLLQNA